MQDLWQTSVKRDRASVLTSNNFQKYIITNHYQFTTPLSYSDKVWKDNPFSPVTWRV